MQRSYRSQVNRSESGNSAFVENLARANDYLPEAQTLTRKILARSKIVPIPWSYWERYKCGGQPRHNLKKWLTKQDSYLKKSPLLDHVSTNSLVALSISSIVNTPISFCCGLVTCPFHLVNYWCRSRKYKNAFFIINQGNFFNSFMLLLH